MSNFEYALTVLKENDVDAAIGLLKGLYMEKDDPRAACKLGDIFHDGHGGGYKDDILAARWYFKAAKMQSAEAQYMLGNFFLNGWGVPQNPCQAHKWYNLATMNGHKGALEARDRLGNMIAPERVAQAQDLAVEWMEAHLEPAS